MIPGENVLLLLPLTVLLSTKQTTRGRHSPMYMLDSQLQGHQGHSCWRSGGLVAPSVPPHLPPSQSCRLTSWWGWAELCHRAPHHWSLSNLNFPSTVIFYWCEASFQQHTAAPLLLLIHADHFPKPAFFLPPPLFTLCSSTKCSSSAMALISYSVTRKLAEHDLPSQHSPCLSTVKLHVSRCFLTTSLEKAS